MEKDKEEMSGNKQMERRSFLKEASMLTLAWISWGQIAFAEKFPKGLIPISLLEGEESFAIQGKSTELIVLNDKPINAETPAHLLDDKVTQVSLFL